MSKTTFSDRVALARRTLEWYEENRGDLSKKGLQPSYWIENLQEALENAANLDEKQEILKAQLKEATAELNRWDRRMYRLTSGAIDAGIGAYGRGTERGTQLSRMRSKLHRPDEPEAPKAA